MRIHLTDLVDQCGNLAAFDELPTGLFELPDLTEESFRRIVEGYYDMETVENIFPEQFHDFLQANRSDHQLRRKIDDADVEKFMATKPALTAVDIIDRLPDEFKDQYKVFLPNEATKLPPHRPRDHKIELLPGKEAPHYKLSILPSGIAGYQEVALRYDGQRLDPTVPITSRRTIAARCKTWRRSPYLP